MQLTRWPRTISSYTVLVPRGCMITQFQEYIGDIRGPRDRPTVMAPGCSDATELMCTTNRLGSGRNSFGFPCPFQFDKHESIHAQTSRTSRVVYIYTYAFMKAEETIE